MKNLLLITILFISYALIGQEKEQKFSIDKGLWNVEGNISLSFGNINNSDLNNNTDQDFFNFNFSPKLGYSINKNLIIGIGLGYHYHKSEGQSSENFINNRTGDGYSFYPYLKKYIPLGKKIAFQIQGEVRYSNNQNKSEYSDTKYKYNSFFIGLRPGISYQLSEKILLQTNFGDLGYLNGTSKKNDIIYDETKSFNFNLSSSELSFGLTVIL